MALIVVIMAAGKGTRMEASKAQRAIREVHTGIMVAPTTLLARWVMALRDDNGQTEFYRTDIVARAVAEGVAVVATAACSETEVLGVNSPVQLADLERRYQPLQAEVLMEAGVRLADLGDATVGERVNFGAGGLTANYDGASKRRTVIGNDVLVGSNCVLVAPVTPGDDATIGGGSTIGQTAPAGQLTVARARQVSLPGWQRPKKLVKKT